MKLSSLAKQRSRSRPARVVSVCVLGRPATQERFNESRYELQSRVIREISRREWSCIDAIILPAGFFRWDDRGGPLPWTARSEQLADTDFASAATRAAQKMRWRSPGCLMVVGVDVRKGCGGWRGDQYVAAFSAQGLVGGTRKMFPMESDTDGWGRAPYLLFSQDAGDTSRMVRLANGQHALLSACYDGFAPGEIAIGPTPKRKAMRYIADGSSWRALEEGEADDLLEELGQNIASFAPAVHLVAIHIFQKPGRDTYWQRHGISPSSAALGGALAVGASHFVQSLPTPRNSPLAAFRVDPVQLKLSGHRTANFHRPQHGFHVSLPRPYRLSAVVRLYEAA